LKMLHTNSSFTWLIAQEDFNARYR
jgi:hypothetical protein